jgi:hypothetical protein
MSRLAPLFFLALRLSAFSASLFCRSSSGNAG